MTAPPATTKGLGRRTVSGIRWTLWGTIIANLLRIAVVAILGRLLTPADFGIVAAAMIVIFFARKVRDLGVGLALVQRKEITRAHIEATFALALMFGVGLGGTIFLTADAVAGALHKPQSADAIRVLSALFLIRAVASTSEFMCQRELEFRALAIVEVVSYTVGSVTSIVLAVQGYGWWSLVIGYIAETIVDSSMLLWFRPPPRPRLRWAPLKDLLAFGGGQTAAQLANYFAMQGDYIVVGRYLDAATLGIYTRAYELMRFPATVFTNVAGKVLFSAFAKLQDDPERLAESFRRVLFANAIVLVPASAGLIVLAPEAVRILLGPGWEPVVIPFQLMATSMLWRTSHKAAAIVARSAGDVLAIAVWQAAYAAVVIGGALVSVRWGIVGVAGTTALAVLFHFTNLARLALRQLPGHGWGLVLRAHVEPLVLAALAVAGALPTALALRQTELGAGPIAILATIAGAAPALAYTWWRVKRRAPDWVWLLDRVAQLGGRRAKKKGGGKKKQPPPVDSGPGE